jgi:hypothetical protein
MNNRQGVLQTKDAELPNWLASRRSQHASSAWLHASVQGLGVRITCRYPSGSVGQFARVTSVPVCTASPCPALRAGGSAIALRSAGCPWTGPRPDNAVRHTRQPELADELAALDDPVVPVDATGRDHQRVAPAWYRSAAIRAGAAWLVPYSSSARGSSAGGTASMSTAAVMTAP